MPLDTDELFRVLADPTRRRILDLLSEQESLSVNDIGKAFPDLVTSGISKHLMVLRAADLVTAARDGRRQYYSINARVRYFSYVSVAVLLVVTYIQVTYLKRYFRKKKLL